MTRNELFLHDEDHKPRAWLIFHLKTMPLFNLLSPGSQPNKFELRDWSKSIGGGGGGPGQRGGGA